MKQHRAQYLVVDTSAFINSVSLHNTGENVITIPEVIAEVRDKRQYRHLLSLTHEVELRDVFSESIAFVTEFAKKTGDYAALSATDIKLIALTYQLEVEHVGRDHLRQSPVIKRYDMNVKPAEVSKPNINNGLCLPTKISGYCSKKTGSQDEPPTEENESSTASHGNQCTVGNSSEEEFLDGKDTSDEEESYDTANESLIDYESDSTEPTDSANYTSEENSGSEYEDEDDDSGWITPDNLLELKRSSNRCFVEETPITVGCLTTDFAIQNVLMQIGLNVITVDGKVIRELRSYILRCYACSATTPNMHKVFCPKCGYKTLKRVSVYLDKDGNKRMFINFKKPISLRGKRFSLPMPQGGKHAVNPRLVEDARRPHQKPTKLARMKTNAMEADYIAGSAPFVMRDIHSRSAQHGFNKGKHVFKYWMRKNPNEARRNPKK